MKKKKIPTWIIVLLVILAFGIVGNALNSEEKEEKKESNIKEEEKEETQKVDKSSVLYQDDNFIAKIVDYEYKPITDRIVIKLYFENNSDKDTTFLIDSNVSVDGIMVDGRNVYEVVKPNTKSNKEMTIYNLNQNGLDGENVNEMKFNLNIYQSENYIINNRIVDNQEMTYQFKK